MKLKILSTAFAIISIACQIRAQADSSNSAVELPGRYFQLLEAGIARVEKRLAAEPDATLASLEEQHGWHHFPNAILMPAVLYTKSHPANKSFGDERMLQLANRIGDFLIA